MFDIKSYLWYQRTLEGRLIDHKPRVLKEDRDYTSKNSIALTTTGGDVAKLSDCRPLLTIELEGKKVTEGDIFFRLVDFYKNSYGEPFYEEIDGKVIQYDENYETEEKYKDEIVFATNYPKCNPLPYTDLMFEHEGRTDRPLACIVGFAEDYDFRVLKSFIRKLNGKFKEAASQTSWFMQYRAEYNSFFDDPAKYSNLLWGCSEEEGWKKIFKILNIA